MNSLQDLNNSSGAAFEFTDDRPAGIVFVIDAIVNQTVDILEGQDHTVPVGIEILEVINYADITPTYKITFPSALSDSEAIWDTIPSGCTVTHPTSQTWIINNVNSKAIWDIVKSPRIVLPNDYNGTFVYLAEIAWAGQTRTWQVTTTVENVDVLTVPSAYTFNLSSSQVIAGAPQVIDLGTTTPTYTVTLTPDGLAGILDGITSLSSAGSGGSSSYNGTTKVLTMSGSKTQVNSHLSSITYVSNTYNYDWVASYYATNNLTAETDLKKQYLISSSTAASSAASIHYYVTNVSTAINNPPLLTTTISGTYTVAIVPSTTAAVDLIQSTGTGGTVSFNSVTKIFIITGTYSEVNARLTTLRMTTLSAYNSEFFLVYQITDPNGLNTRRVQQCSYGSSSDVVTNMNVTRIYNSNNYNTLFSSTTPAIADSDETATYTVTFSSPIGEWKQSVNYMSTGQSVLTITGTKTYVNSLFAGIRFYPNYNVSSNSYFTYTQIKTPYGGSPVTQVTQNVLLIGNPSTFVTQTREYTYSEGTVYQTFQPIFHPELYKYAKMEVLAVGGGGGGASGQVEDFTSSLYGGAGGAGGRALNVSNVTLDFSATPITDGWRIYVGAPGQGGQISGTAVFPNILEQAGTAGGASYLKYIIAGTNLIYSPGGTGGTLPSGAPGTGGSTAVGQINGTNSGTARTGGTQTGTQTATTNLGAGGGSGTGENGSNASGNTGGDGGDGLAFSTSGSSVYYGGGGGGGSAYNTATQSSGGLGGGSGGSAYYNTNYSSATNGGGGGGGAGGVTSMVQTFNQGKNGSAGIVWLRFTQK